MKPTSTALAALASLAFLPAVALSSALVLDMDGDGLDFGGQTTTELLGGGTRTVYWTRPVVEDCFLMLDATTIREAGFTVLDSDGKPLEGNVLFRDGITIRPPAGNDVVTTDGWDMLQLFDHDQDGRIGTGDPVWPHLWMFMDYDSSGSIVGPELHRPPVALLAIETGSGSPYVDAVGNTRRDGSWVDTSGTPHDMAGVLFANAPPVSLEAPATWGSLKSEYR